MAPRPYRPQVLGALAMIDDGELERGGVPHSWMVYDAKSHMDDN